MNTILVWVLVVGQHSVTFSPPMADLQSCEFLKKEVTEGTIWSKCVQIRMVK
jgi:hypothetical protein